MKSSEILAEITGPYGPVTVAEKVIQRLWARGVFTGMPMLTASGKKLTLVYPGKPNTAEGPDFREAVWEICGERFVGDAEIHFYREDWRAHGHDRDPEFDGVALHVVVFPPTNACAPARTHSGREPETITLLAYLPEDLESVAAEDALLAHGGGRDGLVGALAALDPEERTGRLERAAMNRWESKVRFARHRIETEGLEATAHRLFLETLGLRRNRAPMSDLARLYAVTDFAGSDGARMYAAMDGRWKLAGVRPANHPRTRLEAYCELARRRPDWFRDTLDFITALPHPGESGNAGEFRKRMGLVRLRATLADEKLGGSVGGTRLDTLVVDALLPWAAAAKGGVLYPYWRNWPMGDAPGNTGETLAALGLTGPGRPTSNGLFQGLLGVALGM